MVEEITITMDEKRQTVGGHLNLSKAFDSVDIEIPLSKLEMYRIQGNALHLTSSYVKGRKQCLFF